jgi:hypothetical protein
LSWEDLIFLITHGVRETTKFSLSKLWKYSNTLKNNTYIADKKNCFLSSYREMLISLPGREGNDYTRMLETQINLLKQQGTQGKTYWEQEKTRISSTYSKEKAIRELIQALNIDGKIKQIDVFIGGLTL